MGLFDWQAIANDSVKLFIGAAAAWVFQSITKLRKDADHAFRKIRALEDAVYRDDDGTK